MRGKDKRWGWGWCSVTCWGGGGVPVCTVSVIVSLDGPATSAIAALAHPAKLAHYTVLFPVRPTHLVFSHRTDVSHNSKVLILLQKKQIIIIIMSDPPGGLLMRHSNYGGESALYAQVRRETIKRSTTSCRTSCMCSLLFRSTGNEAQS